jgi:hypothetical protein
VEAAGPLASLVEFRLDMFADKCIEVWGGGEIKKDQATDEMEYDQEICKLGRVKLVE